MDIKEFISNFEQQFDDVEPNTITAETVFRDIPEWSSLTVLLLIGMVDSEYNVSITGNDIKESKTINDLFEKVLQIK